MKNNAKNEWLVLKFKDENIVYDQATSDSEDAETDIVEEVYIYTASVQR